MSRYSIAINGGDPVEIDMSGIVSFTREQNSLNSSWLKIQTAESFAAAEQWALKAQCELFLNGVRIFLGTFIDPTGIADPKSQGKSYLVECPWRRFRRTPYEQPFSVYAADTVTNPAETPAQVDSSWAILWGDNSSSTMVKKCCDFLITDQTNFPAAPEMVPISKGIIDATITLRPVKVVDCYLSEIVQRSTEFLLDAVHWWDWSSAAPSFNLRTSDNMDIVPIPFGRPAAKWQLQRTTETQLAYVRVVLQSQVQVGDTNRKVFQFTLYPADYAGPKLGGVSQVSQLTDLWDLALASNFAQRLYDASQLLSVGGSVTVTGRDIDTALRPGVVVPIPASEATYSGLNAIVFKTVDDLKTGTTTATFTPRKPLTVQALVAMMRMTWPPVSPEEKSEQGSGQNANSSFGMGDKNDPQTKNGGLPPGFSAQSYDVIEDVAGTPTKKTGTVLGSPPT